MREAQEALREHLRAARRILVFTGAGISTGSGIPDFRGPQGIWKTRQPVYYDEFLASADKRREYWAYKAEGWEGFRDARPNAAHRAIARLEQLGRLVGIVTQNIDGLHQAAGSSPDRVIELHGTNRWTECVACGQRDDPDPAVARFRATAECPTCGKCGGFVKFATISFGQALDPRTLQDAGVAARQCDLVVALGSTLSVSPANQIPLLALRRSVPYLVVNRGETEHDLVCTTKLDDDVVAVLPGLVAQIDPV